MRFASHCVAFAALHSPVAAALYPVFFMASGFSMALEEFVQALYRTWHLLIGPCESLTLVHNRSAPRSIPMRLY